MTTKSLLRHDLTCFNCQENYIVLLSVDSEAEPTNCPICGSTEIGAYGSERPVDPDEEIG